MGASASRAPIAVRPCSASGTRRTRRTTVRGARRAGGCLRIGRCRDCSARTGRDRSTTSSSARLHVERRLDMSGTGHVVLLGDSIFDNGAYVSGGPDVVAHLRAMLPRGWEATLLAVDGAVIDDVFRQLGD